MGRALVAIWLVAIPVAGIPSCFATTMTDTYVVALAILLSGLQLLVHLLALVGLLLRKTWGRVLTICLATITVGAGLLLGAISLPQTPIGLAVSGVYTATGLWVFIYSVRHDTPFSPR